jgi:phosphoribosylglycinamide formyltransferase-1
MAALLHAATDPAYPAEIALVVSNRPDATGLDRARDAGVPAALVDHRGFATKPQFEAALDRVLRDAGIELACLAGFMRLLSAGFVEAWRDRLLNIHPSLLPAFPGLDTHARALAAGVRIHGATVHFVRAETDQGPIVVQGALAVRPDDTPETLAARVLEIEHRIYPLALKLVASGAARVVDERVTVVGQTADEATLLSPRVTALRSSSSDARGAIRGPRRQ